MAEVNTRRLSQPTSKRTHIQDPEASPVEDGSDEGSFFKNLVAKRGNRGGKERFLLPCQHFLLLHLVVVHYLQLLLLVVALVHHPSRLPSVAALCLLTLLV